VIDLDTRLRSAGASLRASVEDLEPGALPSPGPARRPLLATAAVVLLVVAVVAAVAALRRDPDEGVSTNPDEVPRLVLDESLLGMPATGAVELPLDQADALGTPVGVTVFEAPVGEGGVARIGVITLSFPEGEGTSWEPDDNSEPVTVRGSDAWVQRDDLYGESVSWPRADDEIVVVGSRDLDREQLLAAVEAGDDGSGGFLPGPVAPGLGDPEPLGRPAQLDMFSLAPVPVGAVGHGVGYQSEDQLDRVAFLSVVAAGDDDVTALRWMTGAETPVEVRGHPGWIGTRSFSTSESAEGSSDGSSEETGDGSGSDGSGDDGGDTGDAEGDAEGSEVEMTAVPVESHTLIWSERPGVVAVLSVSGYTVDEVLGFAADGIGTASDAEWAELVEAADSPTPRDAGAAVAGGGGDVEWSVYIDDEGLLCGSVQSGSTSGSTCGDLVEGGAELLTDDDGNDLAVYGVYPEGAVDVRAPDGSPLGASTAITEDGRTVYAISLDQGPTPTEVVFVGADGNEVGRMEVGFAPATEAVSPTPPGP
jgi:hypothetical protein